TRRTRSGYRLVLVDRYTQPFCICEQGNQLLRKVGSPDSAPCRDRVHSVHLATVRSHQFSMDQCGNSDSDVRPRRFRPRAGLVFQSAGVARIPCMTTAPASSSVYGVLRVTVTASATMASSALRRAKTVMCAPPACESNNNVDLFVGRL